MLPVGTALGTTTPTGVTGEAGPTAPPRLVKAAHEFEAQMMKELLQPMVTADASGEDDGDGLGSSGALGEFASETLGRALSEQGGLGIADQIVRSLALPSHDSSFKMPKS